MLNPDYEFDFNIESCIIQAEVNKYLEDCRGTQELAIVTTLGRELDSFIFKTAENYQNLRTEKLST